jgi:hypothetical protein
VIVGAADRVHRSLGRRNGLGRERLSARSHVADRPRSRSGLGLPAELLDAPLDYTSMPLRLLEVLLEALLVRRSGGEPDVRLKRGLELLLLAICLVEVLDQLCVAGVYFRHEESPTRTRSQQSRKPRRRTLMS